MLRRILLSRDQFREQVQERDGHRCVICGKKEGETELDSHHIIERRLWRAPEELGGYFLDNGATLCASEKDDDWSCHLLAGMTILSPEEIRKAAGIENVVLPSHLYEGNYTVWADPVLPDGRRMRGELFHDESVQKMLQLGGMLGSYTPYVRHFRTYHLPFSPKVLRGDIGDDKVMHDLSRMKGNRIIVTAKLDGSNSSWYRNYLHLRTLDFKSDPSTHRMQAFHAKMKHNIPDGWRINVENLVGSSVTGIQYSNLESFFMPFMIWNEKNECLSWEESVEWFNLLDEIIRNECNEAMGFPHVRVLYDGIYDEDIIKACLMPMLNGDPLEGLVVRVANRFAYMDSFLCVGKFVREQHQVRHGGMYIPNHLGR